MIPSPLSHAHSHSHTCTLSLSHTQHYTLSHSTLHSLTLTHTHTCTLSLSHTQHYTLSHSHTRTHTHSHSPRDAQGPVHRTLELLNGYHYAVTGAHAGLPGKRAQRHVYLARHARGVAEVPVLAIRWVDLQQHRLLWCVGGDVDVRSRRVQTRLLNCLYNVHGQIEMKRTTKQAQLQEFNKNKKAELISLSLYSIYSHITSSAANMMNMRPAPWMPMSTLVLRISCGKSQKNVVM